MLVKSANPKLDSPDTQAIVATTGVAATRELVYDIIWNTTLVCPWDCAVCCVAARHVTTDGNDIVIRSKDLSHVERIPYTAGQNKYDKALRYLQSTGRELTWAGKLAVLDNLAGHNVRLDISGGDALIVQENFLLLEEIHHRLGKENVTLTITGAGLGKRRVEDIAPLIGEFNFTFVAASAKEAHLRPGGYSQSNLKLAKKMGALSVPVRAELPLTNDIINRNHLERIYTQLAHSGVQKLLLMRLFPVGRGTLASHAIPSKDQYRYAIDVLRECEARIGGPRVLLQCALRHFDTSSHTGHTNPCDLVRESFGLIADGTLLASPWAIDSTGAPLDESFVIGNLATTPLSTLLRSETVMELQRRGDENTGHCKIFAFQNSLRQRPIDRMVDTTDPLYTESSTATRKDKKVIWAALAD